MTARRGEMALPDPWAACCWPRCEGLPDGSDFFCRRHAGDVPAAIMLALQGAVWENNLVQWRQTLESLRQHEERQRTP